jgi:hypothetical protein
MNKPVARPIEVVQARTPDEIKKTQVPDGSVSDVLEWVGDDAQRASTALAHEEGGKGRKTLVTRLSELTDADTKAIETFEAEGGHVE